MSDVSEAGPNAFMIHSLGSIQSIYWPIPFINDNFCYFWSQTKIPLKKAVASQSARLNIFSVLFPTYLWDKVTTLGLFTSSLLRIQLRVGGGLLSGCQSYCLTIGDSSILTFQIVTPSLLGMAQTARGWGWYPGTFVSLLLYSSNNKLYHIFLLY